MKPGDVPVPATSSGTGDELSTPRQRRVSNETAPTLCRLLHLLRRGASWQEARPPGSPASRSLPGQVPVPVPHSPRSSTGWCEPSPLSPSAACSSSSRCSSVRPRATVPLRYRRHGRPGARGPATDRHPISGNGCPAYGRPSRAGQAAGFGGDPGLDDLHLHRQDGHPHPKRNVRGRGVDPGW
jgi:hypothetical protein